MDSEEVIRGTVGLDGTIRLVCLVRLQTDNFGLFLRQQDRQMRNFRLNDKQIVSGLRKIAWASVFRLKIRKTELTRLFAANGRRK